MGWEREEREDGEREDRGESTREVWRVAQEEDQQEAGEPEHWSTSDTGLLLTRAACRSHGGYHLVCWCVGVLVCCITSLLIVHSVCVGGWLLPVLPPRHMYCARCVRCVRCVLCAVCCVPGALSCVQFTAPYPLMFSIYLPLSSLLSPLSALLPPPSVPHPPPPYHHRPRRRSFGWRGC